MSALKHQECAPNTAQTPPAVIIANVTMNITKGKAMNIHVNAKIKSNLGSFSQINTTFAICQLTRPFTI